MIEKFVENHISELLEAEALNLTSTVETLRRWLDESAMEKYDRRSEVWLNREGNPHTSRTLNRLLQNLLVEADIESTNRNIVGTAFDTPSGHL